MPLLKKKSFTLLEPPDDLSNDKLVYQVRFTKEIFVDYQKYLSRINMYRQRVWTCKITGKSNLTYEEALVSEKLAAERVQAIPKDLVAPALQMIQFSMLSLKNLSIKIADKLQDQVLLNSELLGKKNGVLCCCRILEVVRDGMQETQYRVAWLDEQKDVIETSLVHRNDIIMKKLPLSRNFLKSFIRDSTYRSAPWMVHDSLARKHQISSYPPDIMLGKNGFMNGASCDAIKRRHDGHQSDNIELIEENRRNKKIKQVHGNDSVKYPIDDMLVEPCPDDPIFTERPVPSKDFIFPVSCVGDLLMVWDFCSSFSRLLNLWPFSFEEFGTAVTHKDNNSSLIVETHIAILRFLNRSDCSYFLELQKKNRKLKLTAINWTDCLCEFLEWICHSDFKNSVSMIKRGHYGLLDVQGKVDILRVLVDEALETDLLREKLDEYIEQWQVIGATKREIALQEGKKKRTGKEVDSDVNNKPKEREIIFTNIDLNIPPVDVDDNCNGDMNENDDSIKRDLSPVMNDPENDEIQTCVTATIFQTKGASAERKEALRQMREEKMEEAQKRSKEQRKQYFDREMEKRAVRTNCLGKDRYNNRYWWFQRDGRLFVESSDSRTWGYYSTKEELDALLSSLNPKGEREKALQIQLNEYYGKISSEFHKRSKVLAHKTAMKEAVLRRSTRVRATPREVEFQSYVNKWKVD